MNMEQIVNTLTDPNNKALVVLSGGQDSVTCLGLAIECHGAENVSAIGFTYGQNHEVEIDQAHSICSEFNIDYQVIDISFLKGTVTSALTSGGDVNAAHPNMPNLPASFVPNRNALFLTISHAVAQEIKARYVYTGVCQTDYSGYPDCREVFIDGLQSALNTGYECDIRFITPLMYMTKAQTFELAEQVGFLETVINESHTCYNGHRGTTHDWGKGCGECGACKLREKGYLEFLGEG
jgi:7-cyano-7-deazaguanine synthase